MKIEVLNCPNCGAAVFIDSAQCRFCTSRLKTMAYPYSPLNEEELTSRLPLMENETAAVAEQIKNVHLVYDLVYNPFETRFLREAQSVGVPTIGGLAMLVAQGAAQFDIWTGKNAPLKEMSQIALHKLQS